MYLYEFGKFGCRTKSDFAVAVAAISFFYQQTSDRLHLTTAEKRCRDLAEEIHHHVPLIRTILFGTIAELIQMGRVRMAIGLFVQFSAYLRPAEMCRYRVDQIVLP